MKNLRAKQLVRLRILCKKRLCKIGRAKMDDKETIDRAICLYDEIVYIDNVFLGRYLKLPAIWEMP